MWWDEGGLIGVLLWVWWYGCGMGGSMGVVVVWVLVWRCWYGCGGMGGTIGVVVVALWYGWWYGCDMGVVGVVV